MERKRMGKGKWRGRECGNMGDRECELRRKGMLGGKGKWKMKGIWGERGYRHGKKISFLRKF